MTLLSLAFCVSFARADQTTKGTLESVPRDAGAEQTIKVTLESVPSGAAVTLVTGERGVTPMQATLPASGAEVRFVLPGFVRLTTFVTGNLRATLEPEAARPPEAQPFAVPAWAAACADALNRTVGSAHLKDGNEKFAVSNAKLVWRAGMHTSAVASVAMSPAAPTAPRKWEAHTEHQWECHVIGSSTWTDHVLTRGTDILVRTRRLDLARRLARTIDRCLRVAVPSAGD